MLASSDDGYPYSDRPTVARLFGMMREGARPCLLVHEILLEGRTPHAKDPARSRPG
jgi:hypothetical protein